MANIAEILARARTIATQAGGTDATISQQIDARGGLRALLNHVIRDVYRAAANDPNFIKDINVRNTISITAGVGTLPDTVMRQFLRQADIQDANGSLVTYFDYASDYSSGQNYTQLGYMTVVGDEVRYTAPAPTTSYTGNLFLTVPSFPTFPADPADDIPMTAETTDDVIRALAIAIQGK